MQVGLKSLVSKLFVVAKRPANRLGFSGMPVHPTVDPAVHLSGYRTPVQKLFGTSAGTARLSEFPASDNKWHMSSELNWPR